MHKFHPSIPVSDNANATLSLARVVFLLSDSTADQLDIAMADAKGRYVHLVAVGGAQPRLKVGALGPLNS